MESVLEKECAASKQKYTYFTPDAKARIAKYAAESWNSAAVRHFSWEFPSLGESTVRLFKKQYLKELKTVGPDEQIVELTKAGIVEAINEADSNEGLENADHFADLDENYTLSHMQSHTFWVHTAFF